MSQGKVIAIKPLGSAQETQSILSLGAASSSAHNIGESEGNLVYIQVSKGKGKATAKGKANSVVWYVDRTGRLKEGDSVEFDINKNKIKSIKGAENVKKVGGGLFDTPGDLLTKIALLASMVFLVAVVLDTKR